MSNLRPGSFVRIPPRSRGERSFELSEEAKTPGPTVERIEVAEQRLETRARRVDALLAEAGL